MPYVDPPTFVADDVLTADQLNVLSDDIADLNSRVEGIVASACRVSRNSNQTITNDTWTAVNFNVEEIDVGGYFPGSGTTITVPSSAVPAGATSILLGFAGAAEFPADSAGKRGIRVTVNGSNIGGITVGALSGDPTFVPLTGELVEVEASDTIQVEVYQNRGSSLSLSNARFQLIRHGVAS